MAVKLLVAILFFSVATRATTTEEEVEESDPSRTDFLRLSSIRFPSKRVFGSFSDAKTLQQTHSLGNFHHRFHPTRFGFDFGSSPTQSSYSPQTHIVAPRPQESQRGSNLRFPGPQENPEERDLVPPQEPFSQSFKTSKQQFGSNQDQYIRNSYPSNAPRTIKFSISSQNYNPSQPKHFENPATPQPKINHQLSSSFTQGRFTAGSQVSPTRPTINQGSNLNYHQPQRNHFSSPPRPDHQSSFQNFNLQPKPSFVPQQIPPSPDPSPQYNLNYNFRPQPSNDVTGGSFNNKPVLASDGNGNIDFHRTNPTAPTKFSALIQSSVALKDEDSVPKQNFGRQQSHFPFPTISTPQPYLQPTSQPVFDFNPTEQQSNFNPYSVQNNFEHPSTEFPRLGPVETSRHQVSTKLPPTISLPDSTLPDISGKKLVYQKSQDHLQLALNGNLLTNHHSNDILSSPRPIAEETFTTVRTTYREPNREIKEITINLNDHKISGDGSPSQLYIKEDRQKEFQEIQAEQSHEEEKSQEDLINEQIHKLLQSQNLEIVGKNSLPQTNSREAQLSNISEQLGKLNYSVQFLNGAGLLGQVQEKQKASTASPPPLPPLPDLPEHIKKQYEIKLINKEDLLKQFKVSGDHDWNSGDSSKVFLANGEKLEVVNFSKDGIMNKVAIGTKSEGENPTTTTTKTTTTTTAKPPKDLFEELRKQVIPPGANFELIKHNEDGQIEKVNDVDGSKKVTFVFLEEQPDGSVKIQGVKGNTNKEEDENEVVDSLIQKIKNGSLKLPPLQRPEGRGPSPKEIQSRVSSTTDPKDYVTLPSPASPTTLASRSILKYSPVPEKNTLLEREPPHAEFSGPPYSAGLDPRFSVSSRPEATAQPATTFSASFQYIRPSTRRPPEHSGPDFDQQPTVSAIESAFTTTFGSRRLKPTPTTTPSPPWHRTVLPARNAAGNREVPDYGDAEILSHRSTEYRGQRLRVPEDVVGEESNINPTRPLNDVLRQNGLNEMAKLLNQSGLNAILNETGPYTIFVPTDKAFRTLKAQLGGSDVAEDKFRENPRLLSGLLLHHVVPGSFRVEDLQNEMTGVSLAGTQLRVNTYASEEKRSKENGKVTATITVNGAKISGQAKDILVPQGLAHSIDRVLFPLPIGDILQTLRSDRERRFTKFLKSLEYSGLSDMLSGSKIYTVFAPTDKAFSVLTDSELDKLLTRREAAQIIVLRHLVPGTLYTSGMKFFQVKDSMEKGQKITIKKELGKIKVNSAQIISANIPATNGVIHVVETLL